MFMRMSVVWALLTSAFAANVCKTQYGDVPCCETSTYVYTTDSDGKWGYENDQWCLMEPSDDNCWSKDYGYPCCKETILVRSQDELGYWGFENNSWCGIDKTIIENSVKECWSSILGYPCCTKNEVILTDESGSWGYEDGMWCGIQKEQPSTTTTTTAADTAATSTTTAIQPVETSNIEYSKIYSNESSLPKGFDNWGWGCEVSFKDGAMIVVIEPGNWGALSIKSSNTYSNGSLRFDMKTETNGALVNIALSDTASDEWISLEGIKSTTEWKTYTLDINAKVFDRFNFQDGTNEGVTIYLRNIIYSTGKASEFENNGEGEGEEEPTKTEDNKPASACTPYDVEIFTTGDKFPDGWENWGWNYEPIEYDSEGNMHVVTSDYGALSFKRSAGKPLLCSGSIHMDILSKKGDINISLDNTSTDTNLPLGTVNKAPGKAFKANEWSHIAFDIDKGFEFDRINLQVGSSDSSEFSVRNIYISSGPAIPPIEVPTDPTGEVVAKALGGRTILLFDVNVAKPSVTVNGEEVEVAGVNFVENPRAITYVELAQGFKKGDVIKGGSNNWTFETSVASSVLEGSVGTESTQVISEFIYGANWVDDKADLGSSVSRFGGNRVTIYNPFGDFDASANDWYFENGKSIPAKDFIKNNEAHDRKTFLTIPALDWVAKNDNCYAYPKDEYPEQKAYDPYNKIAGNGQDKNNNWYEADPSRCNVPWNVTRASEWLTSLREDNVIPKVIAIDNEMEIAQSTHHDIHPETVGYDEIYDRFTTYSSMVREVFDDKVEIAGPSTCNWYFWWNSALAGDKAKHDDMDFLPWFLKSMAEYDKKNGKRLLDILDVHAYLDSGNTCKTMFKQTRTWWDPTHRNDLKEGTVKENPISHQPDEQYEAVIPRLKKLIDDYYPGTKLWFGEYAINDLDDVCQGITLADTFGIFGREGLYGATYWSNPAKDSYLSMAYWLYRNGDGGSQRFAKNMVPFEVQGYDPDVLGTYAARDDSGKLTAVIVNKDLENDIAISVDHLEEGEYTLRYFGKSFGDYKLSSVINIGKGDVIAIPAYTAVFLGQN